MNQALAGKLPVECFGDEYLLWLNQVAIKLSEEDYYEIQDLFAFSSEEHPMSLGQQNSANEINSELGSELDSEKGRLVLH